MSDEPSTLTVSFKSWATDEWAGHVITMNGKYGKVTSNTATCLTFRPYRWYERAWDWVVRKVRAAGAALRREGGQS